MLMTVYKVGSIIPRLTERETEAGCGALTCLRAAWLAGVGQAVPMMYMCVLVWPLWPHQVLEACPGSRWQKCPRLS